MAAFSNCVQIVSIDFIITLNKLQCLVVVVIKGERSISLCN